MPVRRRRCTACPMLARLSSRDDGHFQSAFRPERLRHSRRFTCSWSVSREQPPHTAVPPPDVQWLRPAGYRANLGAGHARGKIVVTV